ncbi:MULTISPECIES: hypothetical protein [Mumia]|uniref:hypothetical protein n=1 Tax=Mumia TaxID=1546255 RepID=UPI001423BFF0|nr:hypothetical protein [Mumia sp. ZJ1417]QMW65563.1 hypothetical protein H4N58_15430 [Mumia sp. ZJ1417]
MAICVVLGGLLMARVSETTELWALRADVRAGEPVRVDDLERVDARLGGDARAHYLAASETDALVDRAASAVWGRDMAAGELVPDAALVDASVKGGVELPLQVSHASVPDDLGEGHRVDVWVAPGESSVEPTAEARRVLDDVTVVAVHGAGTAWGDSTMRGIVVRVDDEDLLPQALAALDSGTVTLVRRGGADA